MDLWSMRDNSFRQAHFWHVFDPFDRNGRPKPTWNLGKKLTWLGWPRRILTMKWGGFLWNICHQDCTLHLQVGKFRSEKMETQAQKNDKLKSRCFKFMYYGGSMGEASTALNWKPSWACAGAIRGKAVKTPALKRMDFGGFWCPRIQVSLMQQLDEQRKLDCDRLALAVASVASVAEMLRNVATCCKKLKSRAARAGVHWGDGREVGSCQISALSELQHFWQSLCTSLKALDSADITSFGHSLCR